MSEVPAVPLALEVDALDVAYRVRGRDRAVLRGVGFSIARGEAYGLVGESGCGKSTVALAALHALPRVGRITGGGVRIDGRDVTRIGGAALRDLRARRVSMVYQDPGRALNPTLTIDRQMAEVFQLLGQATDARALSEAMLRRVQISAPDRVLDAYAHQLSGGMQQRVMIAMALAKDPALLVLDEPTTGLDATVEAEVLDLVATLRRETGAAILFISHNLAVVERMCDRVGVLYAGVLVEEGRAGAILRRPRHPYTVGLLRCLPRAGRRKSDGPLDTIPGFLPPAGRLPPGCVFAPRCGLADDRCRRVAPPVTRVGDHMALCHYSDRAETLPRHEGDAVGTVAAMPTVPVPALELRNVSKTFRVGARALRAVADVSLTLPAGETLGLVGESGSGKTTLARVLLGLTPADPGGEIRVDGEVAAARAERRSRGQKRALQIVFQNPDSALNRSHTVRRLIGRSLQLLTDLGRQARAARLDELVRSVRLAPMHVALRPRQLSGGLKQRVAIARAFAGTPRVVICDEPTSALDVSVQAAILNLLARLQAQAATSYVFITHDLGVVRYLADRIAVLYLGRIMELGPAEDVFAGPHHPYTEALLSASPGEEAEVARIRLSGEIPSALSPPTGCVFHTRCPRKIGTICETVAPTLDPDAGHGISCHLPRDQLGRRRGPPPTAAVFDGSLVVTARS